MANQTKTGKTEQIRDLNDLFRKGDTFIPGQMVMTNGVQELANTDPEIRLGQIIEAVRGFDDFSEDNDPHHEHDFGALEIFGEKLFWKIDYYGPDLMHGSEDPADITITTRVMTIMLASEY